MLTPITHLTMAVRSRATHIGLWLSLSLGLSLLSACQPSTPPAPVAQLPILQGEQLRYPAGHPQLSLLSTQAAQSATDLVVDLPARLVWNENRTQRIYPAFAGRVNRILTDVGQSVAAGTPLAELASPEFGAAQADTARAHRRRWCAAIGGAGPARVIPCFAEGGPPAQATSSGRGAISAATSPMSTYS